MQKMIFKCLVILFFVSLVNILNCADLPTLYEYYTAGGIKSGLKADGDRFTLNGKEITLLSGSMHYFRVPQKLWKDRLLKLKAAGLNAIQFYSPWNLHEETPDQWDFESEFLNLKAFLNAIKEEELFAIYRPGPYICSEWELGGFPAWLLRDANMSLRSNYKPYLNAAGKYMKKILSIVNDYQFSVNGGPIIMLQIENEFGGVRNASDLEYLTFLRDTVIESGFKQLIFTCESGPSFRGTPMKDFPDILETINFRDNATGILAELKRAQPNKPLYVSEFWSVWFDEWGKKFHSMNVTYFEQAVSDIVFNANSSINFYMFHGGTNFGFMNGGRVVTSYDYNAPLSESGNYTDKYYKTKELFDKYRKERGEPMVKTPEMPIVENAIGYGVINITDYLPYTKLLSKVKAIDSVKPKQMEYLDIGTNYGQNFGFILYQITIPTISNLTLKEGVLDRGIVLIDNREVTVIERRYTDYSDYSLNVTENMYNKSSGEHSLEILVENMGRINGYNWAMNTARKGINGPVFADDKELTGWKIYPLEFKQRFVKSLANETWLPYDDSIRVPAIYRTQLVITSDTPKDTFLKLDNWVKGNVFVNGFNIGRYWSIGPQKTLYIPWPLLNTGVNDIYLFELHSSGGSIEFVDQPILG